MARNNILLQRIPAPKQVQLPNGRVFFAKYQRVGRPWLIPTGIRISRTYVRKIRHRQQRIRKIGPRSRRRRRQQAGAGLDLSTAIELGRKDAGSKLGKMMINDAIDHIQTAYKKNNKQNKQRKKFKL